MTEIRITLPEKTADADIAHDSLHLILNRCCLPRCQVALPPGKDFCSNPHRSEYHRKFPQMPHADAERSQQGLLTFNN